MESSLNGICDDGFESGEEDKVKLNEVRTSYIDEEEEQKHQHQ